MDIYSVSAHLVLKPSFRKTDEVEIFRYLNILKSVNQAASVHRQSLPLIRHLPSLRD